MCSVYVNQGWKKLIGILHSNLVLVLVLVQEWDFRSSFLGKRWLSEELNHKAYYLLRKLYYPSWRKRTSLHSFDFWMFLTQDALHNKDRVWPKSKGENVRSAVRGGHVDNIFMFRCWCRCSTWQLKKQRSWTLCSYLLKHTMQLRQAFSSATAVPCKFKLSARKYSHTEVSSLKLFILLQTHRGVFRASGAAGRGSPFHIGLRYKRLHREFHLYHNLQSTPHSAFWLSIAQFFLSLQSFRRGVKCFDVNLSTFCLKQKFLRIYSTMNTVTAQAAGSADPPCCPFVPLCFECGTVRNPCRCRILGPTLGFVAFAVAACVEWPVGAFVYCFRHLKGRRIMAHPAAVVYPRVASCLPI